MKRGRVRKLGKKSRNRIRSDLEAFVQNMREDHAQQTKNQHVPNTSSEQSGSKHVKSVRTSAAAETEPRLLQEQKLSETRKRKQAEEPETRTLASKQLKPSKKKKYSKCAPGPLKKKRLGKRKVGRKSLKIADSELGPSSSDPTRYELGPGSSDPHRYGARVPLEQCDYTNLQHHTQQYFEIDRDSEALNEQSFRYDIYCRCLQFNIEDNNLEDFNSLMDIVYTPYAEPTFEDGGMDGTSDDAAGMESYEREEDCHRLQLLATLTSKVEPEGDKRKVLHPSDADSQFPTPSKRKKRKNTPRGDVNSNDQLETSSGKYANNRLVAESSLKGRLLRGKEQESKIKKTTPHKSVTSDMFWPEHTSEGRFSGSSNNDYDVTWDESGSGDWSEDKTNWTEDYQNVEGGYYIGNKWHSTWSDSTNTGVNAKLWVDGNILQRRKQVLNRKLRNWVTSMRRIAKAGIKDDTLKAWTITRDRMSEVKRRHVCEILSYDCNRTSLIHPTNQAYGLLETQGICIIEDFFPDADAKASKKQRETQNQPLFTCSTKQAEYILRTKTEREEAFNGVRMMSQSSGLKAHIAGIASNKKRFSPEGPRMMLAPSVLNQKAMEAYYYQMDLIIKNMFPENEYSKKLPSSWLKKMTNLVGGTEFQHAHADQGRPHAYSQETTFPFVAMHGFGVNSYEMWLLPTNMKHGFLHKFKPTSLLLMRGDFVHAGGTSKLPRCHMEFFPLEAAGLVHDHTHHYWLEPDFKCDINARSGDENDTRPETTYLLQGTHFPFAYPRASYERNKKGRMRTVLTYPPHVSKHLLSSYRTEERDAVWEAISKQRF